MYSLYRNPKTVLPKEVLLETRFLFAYSNATIKTEELTGVTLGHLTSSTFDNADDAQTASEWDWPKRENRAVFTQGKKNYAVILSAEAVSEEEGYYSLKNFVVVRNIHRQRGIVF